MLMEMGLCHDRVRDVWHVSALCACRRLTGWFWQSGFYRFLLGMQIGHEEWFQFLRWRLLLADIGSGRHLPWRWAVLIVLGRWDPGRVVREMGDRHEAVGGIHEWYGVCVASFLKGWSFFSWAVCLFMLLGQVRGGIHPGHSCVFDGDH